jgi:hypothetical protein
MAWRAKATDSTAEQHFSLEDVAISVDMGDYCFALSNVER